MVAGKNISITGKLSFSKRDAAFALISQLDGIPQNTVTLSTDYLVVGSYNSNSVKNGKSNKRKTADRYNERGLNIQIISEDELISMIWDGINDNERTG